jgi:hypothetical protein
MPTRRSQPPAAYQVTAGSQQAHSVPVVNLSGLYGCLAMQSAFFLLSHFW